MPIKVISPIQPTEPVQAQILSPQSHLSADAFHDSLISVRRRTIAWLEANYVYGPSLVIGRLLCFR